MKMRAADKDAAPAAGHAAAKGQQEAAAALVDRRPASRSEQQLGQIANTGRRSMQLQAWSALAQGGVARLPASGAGGVVQRQPSGERALQYGMLGATIGARAGVYGALAGGAIGAGYGYLTGETAAPTFANRKKDTYQSELNVYRGWQAHLAQNAHAGASAYQSGQFYTYDAGNAAIIHGMLCEGKLMYTYDTENRLRVSGNHGLIKHALLAENRDVYAAGTVNLNHPGRDRLVAAIDEAGARDLNEDNLRGLKEGPQTELFRRRAADARGRLAELGHDPESSVRDLTAAYENLAVAKADAHLDVTEDSGHYSPGYDSGHKAVEAWHDAGYRHITWVPRWTTKRWMQWGVANVDEPEG